MVDENGRERVTTSAEEFLRRGQDRRASFLSDYLYFLRNNRKWWMLPLLLVLLGLGGLVILSSSGAAPFIYTLF
jgi:hypothetical protein